MRAGGDVVRLGGVRGAIFLTPFDQREEIPGTARLELLQSRHDHLALPVLQHLEPSAVVEEILNSTVVDFEYCDGDDRILEGTALVIERVVGQSEEDVLGDHFLYSPHCMRLSTPGLTVRKHRRPRLLLHAASCSPSHRPLAANVPYQRLGRVSIHLLRGRLLIECVIESEGIVIAVLGNAIDAKLGAVNGGRGMKAGHRVVFLLLALFGVERSFAHADAYFIAFARCRCYRRTP
mmetsp:Transcript_27116/g.56456  ORF Transcript_27116/g.56456 Transcript_27116/m.56456 type:complete len:235 (+) Transcript_27116:972-1676(+)